jgi:hypothetical protein
VRRPGTFNSLSEIEKRCVARCCNCCYGLQRGGHIESITAAILMIYIYIYIYIYLSTCTEPYIGYQNAKYVRTCKVSKVYPRTGHEGPEGGRGIAVLFL